MVRRLWRPRRKQLWVPQSVKLRPPMAGGSAKTYVAYNGPNAAAAATAKVTTGTAIKTLMQLTWPAASQGARVVEWGISFDSAPATPIQCELIDTAAVAATVTAYVANDITRMNGPNDQATLATLGTTSSGYTATAEGTVVAPTRVGDYQLVGQAYAKQFPLGREFEIATGRFLRIRVTAAVATNAVCYIVWEE